MRARRLSSSATGILRASFTWRSVIEGNASVNPSLRVSASNLARSVPPAARCQSSVRRTLMGEFQITSKLARRRAMIISLISRISAANRALGRPWRCQFKSSCASTSPCTEGKALLTKGLMKLGTTLAWRAMAPPGVGAGWLEPATSGWGTASSCFNACPCSRSSSSSSSA
jgi:hypothetical protein